MSCTTRSSALSLFGHDPCTEVFAKTLLGGYMKQATFSSKFRLIGTNTIFALLSMVMFSEDAYAIAEVCTLCDDLRWEMEQASSAQQRLSGNASKIEVHVPRHGRLMTNISLRFQGS